MLIEQVDHVDLESLQRRVGNLFDVFGTTVQPEPARGAVRFDLESELCRYHHLVADRRERRAKKLLVGEGPVDFGGIEEGDATVHRRTQEGDHLLFVARGTVGHAHAHTAEPESRDLEATVAQFSLLHVPRLPSLARTQR
jgi:hypothetical protein